MSDTTEIDSIQGILTYQWNFIKLLPINNRDFFGVRKTSCRENTGGGGDPTSYVQVTTLPLVVSPNPTSGQLYLKAPEDLGELEAMLYTPEGRLLRGRRFTRSVAWDLSDLPAGIYVLRVEGKAGVTLVRVVRL